MKIYKRAEFLKLPEGTLYAKGQPWFWEVLAVKGETWDNDWLCMNIPWVEGHDSGECFDRFQEMLNKGASYPLETDYGRDGCFDEEDLFFVFELPDLNKMEQIIRNAQDASAGLRK